MISKRTAAKLALTVGFAATVILDQLGISGHIPLFANVALTAFWIWEPW